MSKIEYLNLTEFLIHVEQDICLPLEREKKRFPLSNKLLDKFRKRHSFFEAGNNLKEIFEIVNELCVAHALLFNLSDKCAELNYEPPISNTGRTIDFKVLFTDGTVYYIDVKTINPDYKDDWNKFKSALDNGLLPENVNVIIDKDTGGGYAWHGWYNSRGRMLEHTISLEEKIALSNCESGTNFLMLFCGNGSDWGKDDLEDFADFYHNGIHRGDDPFSTMEEFYITKNGIQFLKNINGFCYFERRYYELEPRYFECNVRGPKWFS